MCVTPFGFVEELNDLRDIVPGLARSAEPDRIDTSYAAIAILQLRGLLRSLGCLISANTDRAMIALLSTGHVNNETLFFRV